MLNFVLTCFMYGAGIPVLFPIALLCLVILYIYEKKMITRQVRMPNNFDPKMNSQMISVFLYGPILYSGIGYWMYSVPAILNNEVIPMKTISSKEHTNHKILDAFTRITPATPYLFLFVISVLTKLDHHFKFNKMWCSRKSKLQELTDKMKIFNNEI